MNDRDLRARIARRLLQLGMTLFLLGLLTGFISPSLPNPRMGLTSHLEGLLNGIFLLVLGAIWERLALSARAQSIAFWLAAYGTVANWATTLLAAAWGAGEPMMPLAAAGHTGSSAQESIIAFGLISLSVCMPAVSAIVLWGLRQRQLGDR
jgi:hydroxylaminobenzene mutase